MPNSDLNALVAKRIDVHAGLMIMRVEPDGWELPEFEPGQFAVLGVPAKFARCPESEPEATPPDPESFIRRAYSIGSSNRDRGGLEFYISLVESGGLTPRLFALQEGDRLNLSPKITGKFTLEDVPEDQDLLLLSTGTGITPYVSMLRSMDLTHSGRRVAVVHGVRNSWDLGYRAELEEMARANERITYLPLISRPKGESTPWTGLVGYAQDIWSKGVLEQHWKRM
ncbi:MAG TPA: ferredoxin--NADP reductase, partial [Planctomycetota bacterium]|nr:ferredoxin--NADP reductase [Planctomycetota bacterium]